MSYGLGEIVVLEGEFRDPETIGNPRVDPSTVTFKVKTPGGSPTTTTYVYGTDDEVVRSSEGVYRLDVDASIAGTWTYRIFSTGAYQAAKPDQTFDVEATAFA